MGDFAFDTVISGAGISTSWPSGLPSGDRLAQMVWVRMLQRLTAAGVASDEFKTRAATALSLRLEHLMELCTENGMDLAGVESAYWFMERAEPNESHRLLAALPAHTHLTLNMDTLLERVGMTVQHLHGSIGHPGSIMTRVSQYVQGLPEDLEDLLFESVHNSDVVVVGYSGRDLDVFPILLGAVPRTLRWMRHPGSERYPEVDSGLAQLRRDPRCDCVNDSDGVIEDLVDPATVKRVQKLSKVPADFEPPDLGEECMAEVPTDILLQTVASALFDSGALDELDLMSSHDVTNRRAAVQLRKLRARSARQRGHTARALRLVVVPPSVQTAIPLWRSTTHEVSSLLTRAGHPQVASVIDRGLLCMSARRTDLGARRAAVSLRVRLAQRESVRGNLAAAAVLVAPIAAGEASRVGTTPGEVDALTWTLDILKAQGRFVEMRQLAGRLQKVAPFGNSSQKAYAYWQLGQLALLQGMTHEAREHLQTAHDYATAADDRLALAWVHATSSDAWRGHDDVRASQFLVAAFDDLAVRDPLVRQYLHIQSAEHARYLGQRTEAKRHLAAASAIRVPGQGARRRHTLNELAIQMIELWSDGEAGATPAWTQRAEWLRAQYSRIGADACVATVVALTGAVTGAEVPADDWLDRGWTEPVELVEQPWSWRRPWRVLA